MEDGREDDNYLRKLSIGGDATELGGKGYRLADLYKAGFPVPEGFVITTKAFIASMKAVPDFASRPALTGEILAAARETYRNMLGSAQVIVRSSAVGEDTAAESFAGLFTSVPDVTEPGLQDAVSAVYASALSGEAVNYTRQHHLPDSARHMAVIVQRQVQPWLSGVCFTAHPLTGAHQYIVEFVPGHSAQLMTGQVDPSRVVFDESLTVTDRVFTAPDVADVPESTLRDVAENARRIAAFVGQPQDIEWAVDRRGFFFVLQSRPLAHARTDEQDRVITGGQLITQGIGVSPGVATGPIRRVHSDLTGPEADQVLQPGDIAVGHAMRIEHLPALARCAGVISVESSMLSHVAIRMRELEIPSVGGVADALTLAPEGHTITIDGTHGGIYQGAIHEPPVHTGTTPMFFDPDRMRIAEFGTAEKVVYLRVDDQVVVSMRRPRDAALRTAAVNAVAEQLHIDANNIAIDENLAWEGPYAPTTVYLQYELFDYFRRDAAFAGLIDEAQHITRELDERALRTFVADLDARAKSLFFDAVNELHKFKLSRERKSADVSAQLFDAAKKLAGDFIGIIIIDVMGESAVQNQTQTLSQSLNITLVDVYAAAAAITTHRPPATPKAVADNEEFRKITHFAHTLSELKNQRLNVLSVDDYTAADYIRELIALDLDDLVEQYRW